MAKELPEHTDILGQPLAVGNYVAIAQRNCMRICSIIKITPKQIRVGQVGRNDPDGSLVYPKETVLLSGPDAMAYILKYG